MSEQSTASNPSVVVAVLLPFALMAVAAVLSACTKHPEHTNVLTSVNTAQADKEKTNADLVRIREIMEKQEADEKSQAQRDRDFGRAAAEGAAQPLRQLKY